MNRWLKKSEVIADCKKIWGHVLRREALNKSEALNLEPALKKKYENTQSCPLCAFSDQRERRNMLQTCSRFCPYYKKYHEHCNPMALFHDAPRISFRDTPRVFAERVMEL